MKSSLLFFYDYFYPGYKAGGPIQSLTNLVLCLEQDYDIYVVTGAFDLNETIPYTNIVCTQWLKVELPGSKRLVNVLYLDNKFEREEYQQLLFEVNPSILYFNNIYSGTFFRLPLNFFNKLKQSLKIVICPRGMLQKGALAVKPLKKKLYLVYLRKSRMLQHAWWHATNPEEADDILKYSPLNKGIIIAENIPKPPYDRVNKLDKQPGTLHLVFLSLITEKKNLKLLLQVIKEVKEGITLDIYGPVKDETYWKECLVIINELGSRVQYKGDVLPVHVQETISKYHALILLTKGENFGHALYESLSVGRPIITSQFTPWVNLQDSNAGWNVNIDSTSECITLLKKLVQLNNEQLNVFYTGSHNRALEYFNQLDSKPAYARLFSNGQVINEYS